MNFYLYFSYPEEDNPGKKLWKVLEIHGKLRKVIVHKLRKILYRKLWENITYIYGKFVESYGKSWKILENFGKLLKEADNYG